MRAPDPLLILRAQSGEAGALDDLLRLSQAPLHRHIVRLVGETAAEDVLQETLLRIARKLRWLEEPAVYRAWAYRIASREAQRHHGRRRPLETLDETAEARAGAGGHAGSAAADAAASVETLVLRDADRVALRGALDRLSPASRAVVALHYFEEMPLPEIADGLEIPLGTVKSRLGYGLRQLRQIIKEGP